MAATASPDRPPLAHWRLDETYPVARRLHRRLTLIVGPTNSGKTYDAFEHLRAERTGLYLAPLRLLALEGRERLLELGLPASLLTGEERIEVPGAQFTAATVEMLNPQKVVDVAVIDEIQMLADPSRGWAWVQALLGAPAHHVVMAGSADAIEPVRELARYLNEPLEIATKQRFSPLQVDRRLSKLDRLARGTALIAFSRRDVLDYKRELEDTGLRVAVIYGSLGPEVRREEARRFREGEADVLVATDAIAMGLNLPIKRVLFSTTRKWDGTAEVPLDPSHLRQIAGRAGRYGIHEDGRVGALRETDLRYIRAHLNTPLPPLRPPYSVLPTPEQVQLLAEQIGTQRLVTVLTAYQEQATRHEPLFTPAPMTELLALASHVDKLAYLSLIDRYRGALAPVNLRSVPVVSQWRAWMITMAGGRPADLPHPISLAPSRLRDPAALLAAEQFVQQLNLYRWLAHRFPHSFPHHAEATEQLIAVNVFIMAALRN